MEQHGNRDAIRDVEPLTIYLPDDEPLPPGPPPTAPTPRVGTGSPESRRVGVAAAATGAALLTVLGAVVVLTLRGSGTDAREATAAQPAGARASVGSGLFEPGTGAADQDPLTPDPLASAPFTPAPPSSVPSAPAAAGSTAETSVPTTRVPSSGGRRAGTIPATAPAAAPAAAPAPDDSAPGDAPSRAPAPVIAPPAPSLSVYLPTPNAVTVGANRRAPLRAVGVEAGSGRIRSVSVRWSGQSRAMSRDSDGSYGAVVTGLANGTRYTFVTRVCNTGGKCTDSEPITFTPYGTPEAGRITATATGLRIGLSWTASSGNHFPLPYSCSIVVNSTPDDPKAPAVLDAGVGAGSTSFTGTAGTDYSATKVCGNGRANDAATSATVTAAGPTPS